MQARLTPAFPPCPARRPSRSIFAPTAAQSSGATFLIRASRRKRAMTRSSHPRLAPLGVLLWAATSSALPLDASGGAPYEIDGPAAQERSLLPVRQHERGAHLDFERRSAHTCEGLRYQNKDCCTVPIGNDPAACGRYTYGRSGDNCHQYFYKNGAPPPRTRARACTRVAPPSRARGARGPHAPCRAEEGVYQPCRNPTVKWKIANRSCKPTATRSILLCDPKMLDFSALIPRNNGLYGLYDPHNGLGTMANKVQSDLAREPHWGRRTQNPE